MAKKIDAGQTAADLSPENWTKLLTQAVTAEVSIRKRRQKTATDFRTERNEKVVAIVRSKLGMMMQDFSDLVEEKIFAENESDSERFMLRMSTLQRGREALGIQKKFDGQLNLFPDYQATLKNVVIADGKPAKKSKAAKTAKPKTAKPKAAKAKSEKPKAAKTPANNSNDAPADTGAVHMP